ncbi:MAG: bifunctional metallophosphatase/5'-nucleotidase [Polyangiaceae bacterium]|nr:bifunctional metallophosphatase/5'-nucleotidase [Polyangiaceae bacterium]
MYTFHPAADRRMRTHLIALVALGLTACQPEPPHTPAPQPSQTAAKAAPTAPQPPPRAPATVTLLYTTDEHGWLFGKGQGEKLRGGAAEALGQWIADEHHCPKEPPTAAPSPACANPSTLLLSGGDHFTGPAISTYFRGLPMAHAMARMGYVASAFGNHDFDFGRDAFEQNRRANGITYLAANARVTDPAKDPKFSASIIVERRGLHIAVIGVATQDTAREALPSAFEGIAFDPPEPALNRAVDNAYTSGADAVVVLAHACEDEILPIVERHPEWALAFVGLGHCHRRFQKSVHNTPVVMPGFRLDAFARVELTVDPSLPIRHRVTQNLATTVNVRPREGLGPDVAVDQIRAESQTKLLAALGDVIGFSAEGMDDDSQAMGRWITRAMREAAHTDIALTNWTGIRDSLAAGPIRKLDVVSILPFDNTLVVLRVKGSAVDRMLGERAYVASGATRTRLPAPDGAKRHPHETRLDNGTLIDPDKVYTVAVTNFLYDVSRDFNFVAADPSPTRTSISLQNAVITWTAKAKSTEKKPLEHILGGSTKPPPRTQK